MNENQNIFTPEQFRVQAVQLSQAVAELQRRDSQCMDPHDPFANETEFHDYQSDYAEIVPQIRIPGCRIPLKPNSREKSRIRRNLNIVGGFLMAHLVISNLLAIGMEELILWLMQIVDNMTAGGALPADYSDTAIAFLEDSSAFLAINLLAFGASNFLIAWLGCRSTRIPVPNLFRTQNFTVFHAFSYVTIALALQTAMGFAAYGLEELFSGVGITLYEPDFSTLPELKSTLLSIIYSVIVAPVTEELLMRGFVQKNLSRVSQHFGIIATAFLFGVWHENVGQFLLAFASGLLLGYITAKHNSLIPAIICHMCVNFAAELTSIFDTYQLQLAMDIGDVIYTALVVIGVVLLIRMLITERFPQTTPQQSERGMRQLFASPLLLLVILCHIGIAALAIFSF